MAALKLRLVGFKAGVGMGPLLKPAPLALQVLVHACSFRSSRSLPGL